MGNFVVISGVLVVNGVGGTEDLWTCGFVVRFWFGCKVENNRPEK